MRVREEGIGRRSQREFEQRIVRGHGTLQRGLGARQSSLKRHRSWTQSQKEKSTEKLYKKSRLCWEIYRCISTFTMVIVCLGDICKRIYAWAFCDKTHPCGWQWIHTAAKYDCRLSLVFFNAVVTLQTLQCVCGHSDFQCSIFWKNLFYATYPHNSPTALHMIKEIFKNIFTCKHRGDDSDGMKSKPHQLFVDLLFVKKTVGHLARNLLLAGERKIQIKSQTSTGKCGNDIPSIKWHHFQVKKLPFG